MLQEKRMWKIWLLFLFLIAAMGVMGWYLLLRGQDEGVPHRARIVYLLTGEENIHPLDRR